MSLCDCDWFIGSFSHRCHITALSEAIIEKLTAWINQFQAFTHGLLRSPDTMFEYFLSEDYERKGNEHGGSRGDAARCDWQQWWGRWWTRKVVEYDPKYQETIRSSADWNRTSKMTNKLKKTEKEWSFIPNEMFSVYCIGSRRQARHNALSMI